MYFSYLYRVSLIDNAKVLCLEALHLAHHSQEVLTP